MCLQIRDADARVSELKDEKEALSRRADKDKTSVAELDAEIRRMRACLNEVTMQRDECVHVVERKKEEAERLDQGLREVQRRTEEESVKLADVCALPKLPHKQRTKPS